MASGKSGAGDAIGDETDEKTGIPLISLFGKYKPTKEDMTGIDVMVFDMQDVGVGFTLTSPPCIILWAVQKTILNW